VVNLELIILFTDKKELSMTQKSIENIAKHGLLADMAYLDWNEHVDENEIQKKRNLDYDQAKEFLANYKVIGHRENTQSGLDATLFENKHTQEVHLAIRGTEPTSPKDYVADLKLALLSGTASAQYKELKTFLGEMKDNNLLDKPITVTGHSLGGHLAMKLALDDKHNLAKIEHTYTYNAPGIGSSLGGGIMSNIKEFVGLDNKAIPNDNISNIFATAGPEVATGLGQLHGMSIPIHIDDIGGVSAHLIDKLNNSLPFYEAFDQLHKLETVEDYRMVHNILDAASQKEKNATESIMKNIAGVLGIESNLAKNDQSVEFLQRVKNKVSGAEDFKITPLINEDGPLSLSDFLKPAFDGNSAKGMAYRYALEKQIPFVLEADKTFYDSHNKNGELNLFDPCTKTGTMTKEYLTDKTTSLEAMLWLNQKDIDPIDSHYKNYIDPLLTTETKTMSIKSNINHLEVPNSPDKCTQGVLENVSLDDDTSRPGERKGSEGFTMSEERIELKTKPLELEQTHELSSDDIELVK